MKREADFCFYFLLVLLFSSANARGNSPNGELKFEKNKSQWPAQVVFKADINSGKAFFEKGKFTFVYYSIEDISFNHLSTSENPKTISSNKVRCHAFQTIFSGSSGLTTVTGESLLGENYNYFLGNDASKWSSGIEVYKGIRYKELYPSIDLYVYSQQGNLKYDFFLQPHADVNKIRLHYQGVSVSLRNGNLILGTSFNEIIEQAPIAYQIVQGQKTPVHCRYVLKDKEVSFEISSDYQKSLPLIIDPVVVASTYSGSIITNYGSCATYDSYGNIYGGAMCIGIGYPASIGAFDVSFNGIEDVVISKLDQTGSSLIYATYLGGDNSDFVQSIFVNSNNELCLLGSTKSTNFPTSTLCFDNSFNGGRYDIFVTHFDSQCSSILGSTYIGGNNDDGTYDSLRLDWGNEKIGEILSDSSGLIYVTSSSKSIDFPVTAGAQSNAGDEDAVLFIISANCSSLLWSTCIGGAGNEAGNGLRIDLSGDVVITGRTNSADFPITANAYNSSYLGGSHDGFICKVSPTTNSILASTYFGTSNDDKSFLVDLDHSNNIYIIGQTNGNIPITAGTYGNAGSMNFISKFNSDLSLVLFQTVIGNGGGSSSSRSLIPTAFFVDTCENIYFSGFNPWLTYYSGYPTTPNAFNVNNSRIGYFYLAELSTNATLLKFGSLFHGANAFGGNSRFDKYGVLYQAINAYASNPIPATANAYSTNLPNVYNDMVIAKVDFQSSVPHANANVSPADSGCAPFSAHFSSINSHGKIFLWDFGDGTGIDTSLNPNHTFGDTGNFQVQLIVIDSTSCLMSDTFHLNIFVAPGLTHIPVIDTILCNGSNLLLQAHELSAINSYLWNTGLTSSSINVQNPDTFWVSISNGICSVTDSFVVDALLKPNIGPDTTLCEGQSLNLNVQSNAHSYSWSTGDSTASISVGLTNTYWIDVSLQDCVLRDSIQVNFNSIPTVYLGNDILICPNSPPNVILDAGANNASFSMIWSTGDTGRTINVYVGGQYWVSVMNEQCIGGDSINVSNSPSLLVAQENTFFCSYDEAWLDAQVNNAAYLWSTGDTVRRIHVKEPGFYWYQITYYGCTESDTVEASGPFADNQIWFPSAFTPNGDGKNDIFIPIGTDILEFKMDIFDRWGNQIFSTQDFTYGWDGKLNDHSVQPGMYTYQLKYTTSCSQYPVNKTGTFLLLQ